MIAKHPPDKSNPTLDVEVALPEIFRPLTVVVPKPEFETVSHGAVVEPTHSENASPAIESIASLAEGVVVPIPTLPKKYDVAVVVAIKLPTVSCVPVAIRLPDALVVIIEFGENVVAVNICEARVDVDTVDTNPLLPTNEYPCERDGRKRLDENVDEAVENSPPVNPITVDVEAPYVVNGRM